MLKQTVVTVYDMFDGCIRYIVMDFAINEYFSTFGITTPIDSCTLDQNITRY